jgi:hypothetical protein
MATCPKCHGEMVKAPEDTIRRIAGVGVRDDDRGYRVRRVTVGTIYCPTCHPPATPGEARGH